MINLPILPILITLPLIGLVFIFLSSEEDENAEQSKKSALWTSASNFFLSLYLPINFDKSIPHFQFVNTFSWFNNYYFIEFVNIAFVIKEFYYKIQFFVYYLLNSGKLKIK